MGSNACYITREVLTGRQSDFGGTVESPLHSFCSTQEQRLGGGIFVFDGRQLCKRKDDGVGGVSSLSLLVHSRGSSSRRGGSWLTTYRRMKWE
jgi:hypothetical protein